MRLQGMTLGLSKNPNQGEMDTQRWTLGLVGIAESAKQTTSQRLTRGLVNNGDSPKLTTTSV